MILVRTPLRISFFGGGTDLASYFEHSKFGYGSVLSTSINKYIYIAINKRHDNKIRVIYNGNELVDTVDEIKHNIIRNAMKLTGVEGGVEIAYFSDLSISDAGVGLSSSSALTVGVLNALHAFKNEVVSDEQLCKEAYHLEKDMIGQPCGIQDQAAVAYGNLRKYRFFKDGSIESKLVDCPKENIAKLKENIIVYFVGNNKNRNSGKILKEQDESNKDKMAMLDNLVEAVDRNYNYLLQGEYDAWGKELDKAWQIKKQFSTSVSNEVIDSIYSRAINAGALGGKILGAGGGGFIMLYVPHDKLESVRNELKDLDEFIFEFDEEGSSIVYKD